jgi:hypothetical protein
MGTMLVIIEEAENGIISAEESPFSDGVYNALWEKSTSIFFDMRIKNSIPVVSGNLNVEPYIKTAKDNGADSIILIKFDYISIEKGDKLELKIDDASYNIYSINRVAIIKAGKKSINYKDTISKKDKDQLLRKIGYDLLSEIYN